MRPGRTPTPPCAAASNWCARWSTRSPSISTSSPGDRPDHSLERRTTLGTASAQTPFGRTRVRHPRRRPGGDWQHGEPLVRPGHRGHFYRMALPTGQSKTWTGTGSARSAVSAASTPTICREGRGLADLAGGSGTLRRHKPRIRRQGGTFAPSRLFQARRSNPGRGPGRADRGGDGRA